MNLPSGDAFAELLLEDSQNLAIGAVDIANAVYMMALPEALRPYFALQPLPARYLGLQEVDGKPVFCNNNTRVSSAGCGADGVDPCTVVVPRIARALS